MHERLEERVDDWRSVPFSDGYADLRDMADEGFSGVVETDQGAWLCLLNGSVVGVFDGDIEEFDGASGTAYAAPEPSLPLLFAMLERGGNLEKQYYTNDTPISEAHETLSSGGFAGYLELSENVLSGDYYVCYYGDRSMSVGFVGSNDRLVTGEEAFDRADDEVGIYDVYSVDLEVVELPDPGGDDGAGAGPDSRVGNGNGNGNGAGSASASASTSDHGSGGDSRTGDRTEAGPGDDRREHDRRPTGDRGGATARRDEGRSTGVRAGDRTAEVTDSGETAAGARAGDDGVRTDDEGGDPEDGRRGDPLSPGDEGVVDGDGGDPLAPGTAGRDDRTDAGDGPDGRPDGAEGPDAAGGDRRSRDRDRSRDEDRSATSGETRGDRRSTRDDPGRSTADAPSGRRDERVGRDGRREGGRARDADSGADGSGDRPDDSGRGRPGSGRNRSRRESTQETDANGGAEPADRSDRSGGADESGPESGPPADRRDDRPSGATDPTTGDDTQSGRRPEARAAGPGAEGRESPGPEGDRRPARTGPEGRQGRQSRGAEDARDARNGRSEREADPAEGRRDRSRDRRSTVDETAADRLRDRIRRHESAIDRLRDRVATLEATDDAAEESVDRVRSEVADLADDLGDLRRTVVRLDRTVDRLEDRVDGSTGPGAGGTADRDDAAAGSRDDGEQPGADLATDTDAVPAGGTADREGPDLTPEEALSETTVLVRYGSQGQATLETAHQGEADAEAVDENLQLTTHTSFDASAATVDGRPYRAFLDDRLELRFFRWLLREHFYEVRETGNADALGDLYDAVPQIDRAEFRGAVAVDADEDGPDEVRFDLVARDGRDRPLVAMNFHDSRDPATEGMVVELQDRAKRVCATSDLAAAYLVATSYFEGAARDTAENATAGSLLSRSSKKSYLRVSRRRGFHLCLVAVSEGDFHLKLPEL